MRDAAEPHVRVLENESWVWQQTRFLCATAWTDFSSTGSAEIAKRRAAERMSDFRKIRAGPDLQRLRPENLVVRNVATHAWLFQELSRALCWAYRGSDTPCSFDRGFEWPS